MTDLRARRVPAHEMPDFCELCNEQLGSYARYWPYAWHDGLAYYTCRHGHSWTCDWGHDQSCELSHHTRANKGKER